MTVLRSPVVSGTRLISDGQTQQDFRSRSAILDEDSNKIAQLMHEIAKLQDEKTELESRLRIALDTNKERIENEISQARQAGYQVGLDSFHEHISRSQNALENLFSHIKSCIDGHVYDNKPIVTEGVFTCLCKILGDFYRDDRLVEQIIATVLNGIRDTARMRIFVSHEDYLLLSENIDKKVFVSQPAIEFVPDGRVAVGGCIVESDMGIWDARLDTQLKRLQNILMESASYEKQPE